MSAPGEPAQVVGPSTLITVKVLYNDNTRRFKVPLRDLNAHVLPQKVSKLLHLSSSRPTSRQSSRSGPIIMICSLWAFFGVFVAGAMVVMNPILLRILVSCVSHH